MVILKHIPIAALAFAALAGCDGEPVVPAQTRLSPEVTSAHVSYAFAPCSAKIAASDQKRVRALMSSAEAQRADAVIVTVPRACSATQDKARIQAIRGLVGPRVPRVDLQLPGPSDPPSTMGIVRLMRVSAVAVDRSNCFPGAGCSVANNIAAQMAYPEELLYPSGTQTPAYHPAPPKQSAPQDSGSDTGASSSSGGVN